MRNAIGPTHRRPNSTGTFVASYERPVECDVNAASRIIPSPLTAEIRVIGVMNLINVLTPSGRMVMSVGIETHPSLERITRTRPTPGHPNDD